MEIFPKMLEKIDFISVGVKPTFNYKSSLKNWFGGCLSLLLIGIVSAALFLYGREMISRDSPMSRIFEEKMSESRVNLTDYPVVFYFVHLGGGNAVKHPLFNQAYRMEVVYSEIVINDQGTVVLKETIIPYGDCTEADLYNSKEVFYSYLAEIENNNCLKLDQATDRSGNKVDKELFLDRAYGGINSKYISFDLYSCDQADPVCAAALEEIGVIYFGYAVLDSIVNISDFDSPLATTVAFESREVSLNFKTVNYASVQTTELITDDSWLVKAEEKEQWFTKGQTKNAVAEVRNNQIAQTIFDSPTIKRVYHRKYIKIQEILGITGGIVKACSVIFSSLSYLPSQNMMYQGLANLKEQRNESVSVSSLRPKNNSTVGRIVRHKKEKKPKTSLFDFILAYFSRQKALELNIDRKSALKYLDIVVLTKKINEIEANIKT